MNLGDPQSFNRYAYVENDPVGRVDPSGLEPADSWCGVEYNLQQCGGGAFWGGGSFGNRVAQDSWIYQGIGRNSREGYNLYLERGTNSSQGYGYITNAQREKIEAIFQILFGDYDESDPQSANPHFTLQATFHYAELSGGLNDNGRALIQEMGLWGPILQRTTNVMGAGALTIIAAPVVADAAVSGGASLVAQQAVNNVVGNANRMGHIFRAKHLLEPLVARFGQAGVVTQVVNALNGLPANGLFNTTVNIAGYSVTVTGRTVMSVPYISNFWIPMGPLP